MNEFQCETVRRLLGLHVECCEYCHDEAEGGYSDLFSAKVSGKEYEVCCKVLKAVREAKPEGGDEK